MCGIMSECVLLTQVHPCQVPKPQPQRKMAEAFPASESIDRVGGQKMSTIAVSPPDAYSLKTGVPQRLLL